ncbi:hypothetical protein LP090_01820 [Moraxella bovis]|uniref:hypothetical protein n=1 Tax=Moraxella bovis TaxID=476 RepID=UPI002225FB58|nr:hypothetical protein [Moraxella bovis]UYZ68214.1 hypothetical protein LP122_10720 [Moraxella bovis]UYZ70597.1 hypothetical protein LP089_10870 [Moraxella bovis]UYZ73483.1 hypothetical protein LP105_01805 [Moraxella bovis]UZA13894.1 hypothetical protein LP102_10910 [Moraxella bovis]UZA27749.1 hypothetical protein LP119_01835 [Moraxella bovis]
MFNIGDFKMRLFFILCFFIFCFGCSENESQSSNTVSEKKLNLDEEQANIFNNHANLKLSKTGIADIKLGQAYDSNYFVQAEDENPEVPGCFFAHNKNLPNNIEFFVMADTIMAIYLSNYDIVGTLIPRDNALVRTNESIKIGDNEEKVLKSYDPDKIIKKISDYTEQPIYIYWYDDSVEKTGIRYDIEDGKVYQIILGNKESLELMEGCA